MLLLNHGDKMNNNLITENLILRKAKKTDLDSIWHNVWEDESIAENMLWKPTKRLEDAVSRLERTIKYQAKNYVYFVCLKESDEAIGFAGVSEKEPGVFEESGICISKKHQGKGYAKEVVEVLKKLVFEELKASRFIYGCFSTNERSRKVCLALGFKYLNSKNITRDWDNKEFVVDNYYFDKEMYEELGVIL